VVLVIGDTGRVVEVDATVVDVLVVTVVEVLSGPAA
jgi:hypothetical protein